MDEGANYPRAAMILKRERYVDDIFGDSDSIQEIQEIVNQVTQLCMAGSFPLKKWISNNATILESIPSERKIKELAIQTKKGTVVSTYLDCVGNHPPTPLILLLIYRQGQKLPNEPFSQPSQNYSILSD